MYLPRPIQVFITFSDRSSPGRTRRDRRVEEERVEQGRRGVKAEVEHWRDKEKAINRGG
jgi:hypothetical protein